MRFSDIIFAVKRITGGDILVTYDGATREYRITFRVLLIASVNACTIAEARDRAETVACYTNDPADVIGTAKAMHANYAQTASI